MTEKPVSADRECVTCGKAFSGVGQPRCRFCRDDEAAAAIAASPSVTYAEPDEGPALQALADAARRVDTVKKPSHYIKNGIEVVLVCEAFLPGEVILTQVVQYLLRAPHKGNRLEDLKKAHRWLSRAIAFEEGRPGSWE